MPEISLPTGVWTYNETEELGEGGFGKVFRGGRAADGLPVAIKRLQPIYHAREMRIAEFLLGHGLPHVIPILDAGFDTATGANFIVMPIADASLQKHIGAAGPLPDKAALEILIAIASGLEEIGDIIHRDLKPGNVLLHEGVWKLADLGLARFAEAATSLNTMRESLTPPYAAPEQWRGDRPSKATDVYALGCIMHALSRGTPPFPGPTQADYSHQHQFVVAPSLDASPHLKRLAAACLAKAPELRPAVPSLRKQLEIALDAANSPRPNRLAAAAAAVAERTSLEEERRLAEKREREQRLRITEEAVAQLNRIFREMEAAIKESAPNVMTGRETLTEGLKSLRLGNAYLDYGIPFPKLVKSGWHVSTGQSVGSRAWDVLAGGVIRVYVSVDRMRSANLWFGQLLEGDDYRWWEVCYVHEPRSLQWKGHPEPEPFSLHEPSISGNPPSVISCLVATDPRPVTPFAVDEFLDRWIDLFARAAVSDSGRARELFPGKFTREVVSPRFRLDVP
jgi:serine/threonine-protein kinase